MISVNMDFCYASLALLLFFHGCIGQDDAATGDSTSAAAAADNTVPFEVSIDPMMASMFKDLGDNTVLSCSVSTTASETPTMKWLFDDVEITETSPVARVHVQTAGDTYMLRIDNIEDNDRGTYQCVASLGGQTDSKSLILEIVKPLKIHSEENQHGVLGQDGTMMCKVTGKPTPKTSWRFGNGTSITNSEKFIIGEDSMVVKNLEFSDEGKYICDIIVRKTGASKKLVVDFVVVKIPVIDIPPTIEPNNAKVGDEVKIHCTANGTPPPTYSFTKDGNQIPEDQIDATSGILTIMDLKREDEAVYNCIASNVGGSDEESNTLDVKIPPVITEIPDIGDATENGQQKIDCIAKGDPAPQVSWKKVGMDTDYTMTQSHPKITVESNSPDDADIKEVKSTLDFDGVKAEDAGSYECTATNIVGTVMEDVKMDVQFSPHFNVPFTQKEFYGWTGHNANLTCQASGNPVPNISWKKFTIDGEGQEKWEDITTGSPYTVNQLNPDNENHRSSKSLLIFISGNDETLYTKYMCEASNFIKAAENIVELKQATAPATPEFSFESTQSTKVTISITKPSNNGGQPVTSYKYTYHVDGDKTTEQDGTIDVAGDHTTLRVKSLKPATTYQFQVVALNRVGGGQAQIQTVTTAEVSKPSKLSITSNKVSDKAESYNIRWAQPDDGGSPITKFKILYKQVKVLDGDAKVWTITSDVDKEFIEREETDAKARSFELTGLEKDSFYDVRVVAVNGEGSSTPEHIIVKTIKGSAGSSSASAGLGSGLIIAIIVIIIFVVIAAVVIAVIVVKRRKAAAGADTEGGKPEDGKAAAEEEKLIQKDSAKVENENEKGDGIEEKQEFEPDQKPEPQAQTDAADEKPKEDTPTVQTTPATPDKPDNPTA